MLKTKKVVKILILLLTIFFIITPSSVFATNIKYQVDIGAPTNIAEGGKYTGIGNYIAAVYRTALGVVGVLAVVVMMFGGIMWMMAGGNPERIQSAKGWVFGAMSGLVLAFSSYTILNIINPDLVKFEGLSIKPDTPGSTNNTPENTGVGGSDVTCIEEGQNCTGEADGIPCCRNMFCDSSGECISIELDSGPPKGCCLGKNMMSQPWIKCQSSWTKTDCTPAKIGVFGANAVVSWKEGEWCEVINVNGWYGCK